MARMFGSPNARGLSAAAFILVALVAFAATSCAQLPAEPPNESIDWPSQDGKFAFRASYADDLHTIDLIDRQSGKKLQSGAVAGSWHRHLQTPAHAPAIADYDCFLDEARDVLRLPPGNRFRSVASYQKLGIRTELSLHLFRLLHIFRLTKENLGEGVSWRCWIRWKSRLSQPMRKR
jgi:hypothetical protein